MKRLFRERLRVVASLLVAGAAGVSGCGPREQDGQLCDPNRLTVSSSAGGHHIPEIWCGDQMLVVGGYNPILNPDGSKMAYIVYKGGGYGVGVIGSGSGAETVRSGMVPPIQILGWTPEGLAFRDFDVGEMDWSERRLLRVDE